MQYLFQYIIDSKRFEVTVTNAVENIFEQGKTLSL